VKRMSSRSTIEDQAAAWLAKRDSGVWQEFDEAELAQWLNAATAHRVAYLRLERIWEEADRLQVLSAGRSRGVSLHKSTEGSFFESRDRKDRAGATPHDGLPADTTAGESIYNDDTERLPPTRPETRDSRRSRAFALAVTVLLASGVGTYLTVNQRSGGEHFTTPIGGTASVPLSDGSHITLNTATDVRVDLSPKERHVNLEKGEAFFVVAKDSKRPFVVEAGSKRVVAVGTQFSVRRDGDALEVVVTEGVVRLETSGPGTSASSSAGAAAPQVSRLPAGTIARARDGDVLVEEHSLLEAQEALSWRQGYLTFHETTLSDAIGEFNRYNDHKIRLDDPALAAIRISGTFRPTNYEAFVRLLREGFSIHVVNLQEQTVLTLK
jgi:transmembrane sensor